MKKTLPILLLVTAALTSLNAFAHGENAHTDEKGNVLVLLSSEDTMQLTNGKTEPTGYYLNELYPSSLYLSVDFYMIV